MTIYGLIPAFNEEETIRTVIEKLVQNNIIPLVVDDGSSDKTAEIAEKAGAVVISHEKNKGKGEALKTGFDYILSKNENPNTVIIDADMQYLPEESSQLLTPLREGRADFVKGFRDFRTVPYANRIGNFGWKTIFNFLFDSDIKDLSCGFMAFNSEALKKIKNIYGGYIVETSILKEAIDNNLRIEQVPVSVTYGKRNIKKFARMFFGVLSFILIEGFKHRLGTSGRP